MLWNNVIPSAIIVYSIIELIKLWKTNNNIANCIEWFHYIVILLITWII